MLIQYKSTVDVGNNEGLKMLGLGVWDRRAGTIAAQSQKACRCDRGKSEIPILEIIETSACLDGRHLDSGHRLRIANSRERKWPMTILIEKN